MKRLVLPLLLGCATATAATYPEAPYLGSTTPLLQTSFCKVNTCKLLATAALYDTDVEETYRISVKGSKEHVILMVLRRGGKVERMSLRNFTQESFIYPEHVEALKFATGNTALNHAMIYRALEAFLKKDYPKAVLPGYRGRGYELTEADVSLGGAADRWITVLESNISFN